jgi:guanylate kinase
LEIDKEESGKLIVVTAPSGAGKTTIVRHLLKEFDELAFSVSATSREPRYYEKDGRDYYFLGVEEFRLRIKQGDFLEWEEVYENQFYGTLKSEVRRLWGLGKHIIFDIDVKGAVNIQQIYPEGSLTLFIKPPSEEELLSRLRNRNTESEESLRKRMERARKELAYEVHFDQVVINDNLEVALQDAERIVRSFLQEEEKPVWKQK